jgi:transposase-like protein
MTSSFPWPELDLPLEPLALSIEQKTWFAQQVIEKKSTITLLAREFGLSIQTVSWWCHMVRKGKKMRGNVGRPRVIDEKSINEVSEFCHGHGFANAAALKEVILEQCVETYKRRRVIVSNDSSDDDEPTKLISRRSMKRYVDNYFPQIEAAAQVTV